MLRIDNTDLTRCKDAYEQAIYDDFKWLGLSVDEIQKQSDRLGRYDEMIQKLKDDGRLYACYETEEELSLQRKIALSSGRPPIYDRSALRLTDDEIAAFEQQGRKPHWRFKLHQEERVAWDDLVRGDVVYDGLKISDPVMIREDGSPLYTICSVIDDIDMEITHIFRGEDHVTNSAVQLQLFEAFGVAKKDLPKLAHFPLLTGSGGEGLSKRLGSLSIQELKDNGLEASAIIAYLLQLGSSHQVDPTLPLEKMVNGFDMDAYGRATPKFTVDELYQVNERAVHGLSIDDVKSDLDRLISGYTGRHIAMDDAIKLFYAVQANLKKRSDIAEWADIVWNDHAFKADIDHKDVIDAAIEWAQESLKQDGHFNDESWSSLTGFVKDKTGAKGKNLFMPLRLAITGQTRGPELAKLICCFGKDVLLERFKKAQ